MVERDAGFTVVEFMVAAAITLMATALAVALVAPASTAFQAWPEANDLQQRLRAAVESIRTELATAGSGPSLGWGSGAPQTWPAVLPCRWTGPVLTAIPGGCATADAITVFSMAAAAPQAITMAATPARASALSVAPASACDLTRSACRLHAGSLALLIDGTSAWDVLTMAAVSSDGGTITLQGTASGAYASGAMIGEVTARSFYLAPESGTGIPQLRRADDAGSGNALVDHAVALSFQYFGAASPPRMASSGSPDQSVATYGPAPPAPGIDNPADTWPAGENCVFAMQQGAQVPRLAALDAGSSGLAPLPLAIFSDGPWCPDSASANRFDADLLRIRLVRVTVRLQAQSSSVRGASIVLFANPGLSRDARRMVPDAAVSFDVGLRNMARQEPEA